MWNVSRTLTTVLFDQETAHPVRYDYTCLFPLVPEQHKKAGGKEEKGLEHIFLYQSQSDTQTLSSHFVQAVHWVFGANTQTVRSSLWE